MNYWEIIADNLSKAGWSWNWLTAEELKDYKNVSAFFSDGETKPKLKKK